MCPSTVLRQVCVWEVYVGGCLERGFRILQLSSSLFPHSGSRSVSSFVFESIVRILFARHCCVVDD